MLNFRQQSLIGSAALLGLAAIHGCSSDATTPLPADSGRSGSGGSPAGESPVAVSGAPGGFTTAGAGGAIGGTGGATGGTGGTGGAAGSTGGATGGTGGTGGATVTFSQITTILTTNCAVSGCHNGGGNKNLNYQSPMPDLYSVLTMMIPAGAAHCVGDTLVKPGNATDSFLYKVIMGGASCVNGSGNEQVGRMPDMCGTNNKPCLTATQIEAIKDWINEGAPHP
jgi:hypothetical protein